jgi:hypothetical protein
MNKFGKIFMQLVTTLSNYWFPNSHGLHKKAVNKKTLQTRKPYKPEKPVVYTTGFL